MANPEVTSVDKEALAISDNNETFLDEAEISECSEMHT